MEVTKRIRSRANDILKLLGGTGMSAENYGVGNPELLIKKEEVNR